MIGPELSAAFMVVVVRGNCAIRARFTHADRRNLIVNLLVITATMRPLRPDWQGQAAVVGVRNATSVRLDAAIATCPPPSVRCRPP